MQAKERSYETMLSFGKRGLNIAATAAVQAAAKVPWAPALHQNPTSTPRAFWEVQLSVSEPRGNSCPYQEIRVRGDRCWQNMELEVHTPGSDTDREQLLLSLRFSFLVVLQRPRTRRL